MHACMHHRLDAIPRGRLYYSCATLKLTLAAPAAARCPLPLPLLLRNQDFSEHVEEIAESIPLGRPGGWPGQLWHRTDSAVLCAVERCLPACPPACLPGPDTRCLAGSPHLTHRRTVSVVSTTSRAAGGRGSGGELAAVGLVTLRHRLDHHRGWGFRHARLACLPAMQLACQLAWAGVILGLDTGYNCNPIKKAMPGGA
jgi:hypothetical protein